MDDLTTLVLQGLQIIWINVLLSADNAVVIALACRGLEKDKRRWAVLGGSLAAVSLRILFTVFVVALLRLPYVKLASGLLLFWIAFGLLRKHDSEKDVARSSSVWGAVRTIALADAIMSLDNVVAVAAAAKNSMPLIIFGIGLSVPLIVFGSTLMLRLLTRFPILVVAGAALLGWVAGEIMIADPVVERGAAWLAREIAILTPRVLGWIGSRPNHAELIAGALGAASLLAVAGLMRIWRSPVAPVSPQDPVLVRLDRDDSAGVEGASSQSERRKP